MRILKEFKASQQFQQFQEPEGDGDEGEGQAQAQYVAAYQSEEEQEQAQVVVLAEQQPGSGVYVTTQEEPPPPQPTASLWNENVIVSASPAANVGESPNSEMVVVREETVSQHLESQNEERVIADNGDKVTRADEIRVKHAVVVQNKTDDDVEEEMVEARKEAEFSCDICSKPYSNARSLRAHAWRCKRNSGHHQQPDAQKEVFGKSKDSEVLSICLLSLKRRS